MTKDQLHKLQELLSQSANLHVKSVEIEQESAKLNQELTIFCADCRLEFETQDGKHSYFRVSGDNILYPTCWPAPETKKAAPPKEDAVNQNHQGKNNDGANEKAVFEKSLIEEIKEMLIEIQISGSLRTRKNGLFELRTVRFGSVYGRTKEELQEKLQQKLREEKSHVKRAPQRKKKNKCIALSKFFTESYFPYKKADGLAERTLKGIRYNYSFIVKSGFDKALNEYTSLEITNFLYSIPHTRKRQIIQGWLNNLFTYAQTLGVIEKNPCSCIAPTKHDGVEGTSFSFEEQKRFFIDLRDDLKTPYIRKCYLIFVYLTGTRRNEALDLTTDDVQRVLHINGTKTDGSDRYIPLFSLVEKLLKSITPKAVRYFPFTEKIADATFKKYGKSHKLHDLRHTFGTIQICVNKLDVKTVSLYMGHSNVQTTLKTYTHPEQLNREIFLDGSLTEDEKNEHLRQEYAEILGLIETILS